MTFGARLLLCLPLCGLVWAAGCKDAKVTEEEKVERALDAGLDALEKNDIGAAKAVLSDDYKDKAGRSKMQMGILANFVLKRGPVRLVMKNNGIKIEGGKATVTADIFAVQGAEAIKTPKDLLPQRAKKFSVTVELVKDGDSYQVTSIEGDGIRVPGAAM